MEACEDPQSQMARSLAIRENARIAQVKSDTDARVRRALLSINTYQRTLPSWCLRLFLQDPSSTWSTKTIPLVWPWKSDVLSCEIHDAWKMMTCPQKEELHIRTGSGTDQVRC